MHKGIPLMVLWLPSLNGTSLSLPVIPHPSRGDSFGLGIRVLEAFGHNKNANSQNTPDPWFYPAELFDNQKEVYKLLPAEIENYQDHVIVYPCIVSLSFITPPNPATK